MSGGAFNSVSDLGPRNSRDYLLRRRFVKIIGFGLGCFNRRIGLGSVGSLAVADFDLTRGKTGSRFSADLKLG